MYLQTYSIKASKITETEGGKMFTNIVNWYGFFMHTKYKVICFVEDLPATWKLAETWSHSSRKAGENKLGLFPAHSDCFLIQDEKFENEREPEPNRVKN